MDLLVTLDQNYLGPLRVLLGSLFLNDPGEEFHIYMIEEGLTGAQVEELSQLCRAHHSQLHPLEVPDGLFTDAPVVRYYSRAMYYRLLAAELLPRELDSRAPELKHALQEAAQRKNPLWLCVITAENSFTGTFASEKAKEAETSASEQ